MMPIKKIILAEITNNIVKELEQRISNIDNQIELLNNNELAKANWNGQKVGLNESIKIVQNEFMKNIERK
jgi:hypothetical protein